MVKILLCVVGVLLAAGGVAALWYGFESFQTAEKLEQQIGVDQSEKSRGGSPARMEALEKELTELEREREAKKTEPYLWFGGAAVALIVGVALALVPWLGKPQRPAARPAAPAPAQSADAAGDGPGQ
jgi:flagellar basal body-associated protein FliL